VRDDVPPGGKPFSVGAIPAGATDNSSPTGGTYNRGYVQVDGFTVLPGESAVVSFGIPWESGPGVETQVVRNQASVTYLTASGALLSTFSDDPATHAVNDSTDLIGPHSWQMPLAVTAFWNQDVNIDLRVVDPCGNAIGPENLPTAECPAGTPGGILRTTGGCGDTWPSAWVERIEWSASPAAGVYQVWLRYESSSADAGAGCSNGGLEDVVVVVEKSGSDPESTIVLDPADTGWVKVMDHTVP
jgi:hypothetical protein